jgi:hypothetical protein
LVAAGFSLRRHRRDASAANWLRIGIIADNHQMAWEGLRSVLEKELWIKAVGEAEEGRTTLRLARELAPEVPP